MFLWLWMQSLDCFGEESPNAIFFWLWCICIAETVNPGGRLRVEVHIAIWQNLFYVPFCVSLVHIIRDGLVSWVLFWLSGRNHRCTLFHPPYLSRVTKDESKTEIISCSLRIAIYRFNICWLITEVWLTRERSSFIETLSWGHDELLTKVAEGAMLQIFCMVVNSDVVQCTSSTWSNFEIGMVIGGCHRVKFDCGLVAFWWGWSFR